MRGRVVDPTGKPVVGMFVYTAVPGGHSFVPSASPAAVTGANGHYDVPCTGGAVLPDSLAAQRSARPDRRRTLGRDLRLRSGVQPQGQPRR